jgi:hypothetical protein
MKKTTILLVVLVIAMATRAQIISTDRKKVSQHTNDKPVTLKPTPLPTAKSPSGTVPPATSQPKPLDLFITNLSVVATKTSSDSFMLAINYTIMNVDTTAVSMGDIVLQGWVGTDPSNGQPYSPGCGSAAGIRQSMLNPGAVVSGTFYCYNKKLSATGRPVYLLGVSPTPGFRIVNESKSQKKVYISL